MTNENFLGDIVKIYSLNAGCRSGETLVYYYLTHAQRLKDLRSVVRLQRRDAHLRENLEQPRGDSLHVAFEQLVLFGIVVQQPPLADVGDAGQR